MLGSVVEAGTAAMDRSTLTESLVERRHVETAEELALPGIERCARRVDGGESATLSVSFTVRPAGGAPVELVVESEGDVSRQLARCVRHSVATTFYPAFDGEPLSVQFEFEV